MKNHGRIAVLSSIIALESAHGLPTPWSQNGHFYQVIRNPMTWEEARNRAPAGWHLATLTSKAEEDFVISLAWELGPYFARTEYWIGAEHTSSGWEWITGEGVFWDDGPIPGTYCHWQGGEPNFDGTQVALDYRYPENVWGWNDEGTTGYTHGYIIERDGPVVPEPNSLWVLGALALGVRRLISSSGRRPGADTPPS